MQIIPSLLRKFHFVIADVSKPVSSSENHRKSSSKWKTPSNTNIRLQEIDRNSQIRRSIFENPTQSQTERRCFRCSMLMLGVAMFRQRTFRKSAENNGTHQHKRSEARPERKRSRRCYGDRQSTNIQKWKYFISFVHLAFIAFSLGLSRLWRNTLPPDDIACASNEITLHRAISFAASQLNGLFSLLFFYFLCELGPSVL